MTTGAAASPPRCRGPRQVLPLSSAEHLVRTGTRPRTLPGSSQGGHRRHAGCGELRTVRSVMASTTVPSPRALLLSTLTCTGKQRKYAKRSVERCLATVDKGACRLRITTSARPGPGSSSTCASPVSGGPARSAPAPVVIHSRVWIEADPPPALVVLQKDSQPSPGSCTAQNGEHLTARLDPTDDRPQPTPAGGSSSTLHGSTPARRANRPRSHLYPTWSGVRPPCLAYVDGSSGSQCV